APNQTANILVSVASPIGDQVVNGVSTTIGGFTVINNQTLTGWEISNNWAQGKPTYFYATFSEKFNPNPTVSSDGKTIYLSFPTQKGSANQVPVNVGISASGVTDSKANLAAEVGNHSFDDIASSPRQLWSRALSRIT